MTNLFPPVLESQAMAIPGTSKDQIYTIRFELPSLVEIEQIKHIQLVLKYKESGEYAINPEYSPDRSTIFIPVQDSEGVSRYPYFTYNDTAEMRYCELKVPYWVFKNGQPAIGKTYYAQIRFGGCSLWADSDVIKRTSDKRYFNLFAPWRRQAISTIPSQFGEWSNLQSVYCYGNFITSVDYNLKDFVPEIKFMYEPNEEINDPLQQCKIVYTYNDINGVSRKTMVFNGAEEQSGKYSLTVKLPIAPVQMILVSVEGVTVNNTVVGATLNIPPIASSDSIGGKRKMPPKENLRGHFEDMELLGKEREDGVIAKVLKMDKGTALSELQTISVYRTNLYTFETIKIKDGLKLNSLSEAFIKDFTVEMGEDYQYIAILKVNGSALNQFVEVYPWGFENSGYGRLMRMDSVFLSDNKHQLKIEGNVSISSLKRNTSDTFQTTLGSRYPFYSRGSLIDYRTFQLSGAITIQSDPTSAFFRYDANNGLWWDSKEKSNLVILNRDLYTEMMISRSRVRVGEGGIMNESIAEYGKQDPTDIRGPSSIYDKYYHQTIDTQVKLENLSDSMVYLERKFRDYVMSWLSNGEPKLFRSETEGNMVVMASAVSFTPLAHTGRTIYTVTMTLTEIADFTMEDLLEYNLSVVDINTQTVSSVPRTLKAGDHIAEDKYLALIQMEPKLKEFFERDTESTGEFVVVTGKDLNILQDVLDSITEFTFVRGDPQPPIFETLYFIKNNKMDIEDAPTNYYSDILKLEGELTLRDFKSGAYGSNDLTFTLEKVTKIRTGESTSLPSNLELTSDGRFVVKEASDPVGVCEPLLLLIKVTNNQVPEDYKYFNIRLGSFYDDIVLSASGELPEQSFDDELVSIRVIANGGLKFSVASPETADFDYLFSSNNLPKGLTLNQYTGEIYGTLNQTNSPVDNKITVEVLDAAGQDASIDLLYGQVYSQVKLKEDSSKWRTINYIETSRGRGESITITPISILDHLQGGSGDFLIVISSQTAEDFFSIRDNNYLIGGTHREAGANSFIIQATVYDKILNKDKEPEEPWIPSLTIDFNFLNTIYPLSVPEKIYIKSPVEGAIDIPSGTQVYIDLFDLSEIEHEGPDTISGGVTFNGAINQYRYSSVNLLPDFEVKNKGTIEGIARIRSDKRTAYITVEDARGVLKSIEVEVSPISSRIQYHNEEGSLVLPDGIEGITNARGEIDVEDFKVSFKKSCVTGGLVGIVGGIERDYNYSLLKEDFFDGQTLFKAAPDWLSVKVDRTGEVTEPRVWILQDRKPELGYLYSPRTPTPRQTIGLLIEDNSPVPETYIVPIYLGEITPLFTLKNGSQTRIGFESPLTVGVEGVAYFPLISGGKPNYTLRASDRYPLPEGFRIYQREGAEQDPNTHPFYVYGIPTEDLIEKGFSSQLIMTDGSGQSITITIDSGNIASQLVVSINPDSKFTGVTLVAGVSQLTDSDPLMEPIIASGGRPFNSESSPYYEYSLIEKPIPGIDLLNNTSSVLVGIPTAPVSSANFAQKFVVQDTQTIKTLTDPLIGPKVVSAPTPNSVIFIQQEGFLNEWAAQRGPFVAGQSIDDLTNLFSAGVGDTGYSGTKLYYQLPTSSEWIQITNTTPQFTEILVSKDGQIVETGIFFDKETMSLITKDGGVKIFEDAFVFGLKAEIEADIENYIPITKSWILKVSFLGVNKTITWQRKNDATDQANKWTYTFPIKYISSDGSSETYSLAEIAPTDENTYKLFSSVPDTLVWRVKSDELPMGWTFSSERGELIHILTLHEGEQSMLFSATDSTGEVEIEVKWTDTLKGMSIIGEDFPDIGENTVGSGVIRPGSVPDYGALVEGGSGQYGWQLTSVDIESGNPIESSPYDYLFTPTGFLSGEILTLPVGNTAFDERKGTILVWDAIYNTEKNVGELLLEKEIVIGRIIGDIYYPKTEGNYITIPAGKTEDSFSVTYQVKHYIGGGSGEFNITMSAAPAWGEDSQLEVEYNKDEGTITISGVYPKSAILDQIFEDLLIVEDLETGKMQAIDVYASAVSGIIYVPLPYIDLEQGGELLTKIGTFERIYSPYLRLSMNNPPQFPEVISPIGEKFTNDCISLSEVIDNAADLLIKYPFTKEVVFKDENPKIVIFVEAVESDPESPASPPVESIRIELAMTNKNGEITFNGVSQLIVEIAKYDGSLEEEEDFE